MRHLLFNTKDLASEIVERIRKSEGGERNNAPALTRDIFEPDADNFPALLKTEEFDKVCLAVDLLIDEGCVVFDGSDGTIRLLSGGE